MNFYCLIFLFIYVAGEFYFFTGKSILLLSLSFLMAAGINYLFFPDPKLIIPFLILIGANVLFTAFDNYMNAKMIRFTRHRLYYLINPIINIALVILLSAFCIQNEYTFMVNPYLMKFQIVKYVPFPVLFQYLLALLIAARPTNYIIKNALASYQPKQKKKEEEQIKTGAFIGTLERIIVILLFSMNEYGAAGLVFTAKSIARYNEIAENKNFAEYYLLGTLLSLLFALGINYLILQ
jgi:hypothetical protein